jgi:hypothetical protein
MKIMNRRTTFMLTGHYSPLQFNCQLFGGRRGMSEPNEINLGRREFVQSAVSGMALAAAPALVSAASVGEDADKAAVLAQIPGMHAANVKRLQDWIALPSIAAEDRNSLRGPNTWRSLLEMPGSPASS